MTDVLFDFKNPDYQAVYKKRAERLHTIRTTEGALAGLLEFYKTHPAEFINDVLARVDIVDVVGQYVQLKQAGMNRQGLCPFHNEKSPSFTVSPTKQFYHCFGCGAHGTALGFLM